MRRLISKIAFSYLFIFIFMLILGSGPDARGQEWSEPVRISNYHDYFDHLRCPYIIATGEIVHVIYTYGYYFLNYVRSTDFGHTWSTPSIIYSSSNWVRNERIIGEDSLVMCIWARQIPGVYKEKIEYCISTDNGQTWSTVRLALNLDWPTVQFAISNSGPLINMMFNNPQGSNEICNIRSSNFGEIWSEPRLIFDDYPLFGLCDQVSSGSSVHFVWKGYPGGGEDSHLYYARSTDDGMTWSDNRWLNGDGWWHGLPKVDADKSGHVGIVWIQDQNVQFIQSFDNGVSWEPIIQVTADSGAMFYSDIDIDQNIIHLAWMHDQFPPLGLESILFTRSSDNGQNWDSFYWIDQDDSISRDPALYASNGRVYVSWLDWMADPDTNNTYSVYFSRWPYEPDAIEEEDADALPREIELSAYPNPFNSSVAISYRSSSVSSVALYDIEGRLVRNLVTDAENGEVIWGAKDEKGRGLSSGIYFARAVGIDNSRSAYLKLIYIK